MEGATVAGARQGMRTRFRGDSFLIRLQYDETNVIGATGRKLTDRIPCTQNQLYNFRLEGEPPGAGAIIFHPVAPSMYQHPRDHENRHSAGKFEWGASTTTCPGMGTCSASGDD